jgi:hypothetical protein
VLISTACGCAGDVVGACKGEVLRDIKPAHGSLASTLQDGHNSMQEEQTVG